MVNRVKSWEMADTVEQPAKWTVAGLADDLDVVLAAQQPGEARADDRMVVDQQHARLARERRAHRRARLRLHRTVQRQLATSQRATPPSS